MNKVLLFLLFLSFSQIIFAEKKAPNPHQVSVVCSSDECFKKFTEKYEKIGCTIGETYSDIPSLCDLSVRSEECIYKSYILSGCKMPFYQNQNDIAKLIQDSKDPISAAASLCDDGYTLRKLDKLDPRSKLVCVEDLSKRKNRNKSDIKKQMNAN